LTWPTKNDSVFSGFAIITSDYLNRRFGYHFVLLDSLCISLAESNYIKLHFAGGGGDFTGRKALFCLLR